MYPIQELINKLFDHMQFTVVVRRLDLGDCGSSPVMEGSVCLKKSMTHPND